jgi:hypothetical protein
MTGFFFLCPSPPESCGDSAPLCDVSGDGSYTLEFMHILALLDYHLKVGREIC